MPIDDPARPGAASAPQSLAGAYKFFPPPARANAVDRKAILQRLLRPDHTRVVVLQGPAGSGKSTTLQQLLSAHAAQGAATAWLTFDEADNDPRRFESLMVTVLGTITQSTGLWLPPVTHGGLSSRHLVEWLLDTLTHLQGPAVICMDELQTLRNDVILQFLRHLLSRLPAQVRVYIGSRTLPEVGLATLLVSGTATVLRAQELRFSFEEAAEFFKGDLPGLIGPQAIATIHQRVGADRKLTIERGEIVVQGSLVMNGYHDPPPQRQRLAPSAGTTLATSA